MMLDKEIIAELKKHKLFEFYWNDDLEKYSLGKVDLHYIPTEVNGYFKETKEIELSFKGNINELENSIAKLWLIYTSSDAHFNIDDAMEKTKGKGVVSAINATVKIYDKKEGILSYPRLIYNFRLWSNQPARIESDTRTIKLLIEAM